MTEHLKQKLNDSAVLRWSVLALVAFTMLCGYFLTDVMSPLKPMLEKELLWDSLDYGFFTSAYGWFNVFLLMLIFGGIILDKMGVRFTGMGACLLMVFGCGLKYYAISTTFPEGAMLFGFKTQVTLAALGYAIFGVGVEIAGITVSKIIVKWFKGKEMALAMGLEMATARIGTTLAMVLTVPLADFFGSTDESGTFHTNIPVETVRVLLPDIAMIFRIRSPIAYEVSQVLLHHLFQEHVPVLLPPDTLFLPDFPSRFPDDSSYCTDDHSHPSEYAQSAHYSGIPFCTAFHKMYPQVSEKLPHSVPLFLSEDDLLQSEIFLLFSTFSPSK